MPIAATSNLTETAGSSIISTASSFTVENRRRQYSESTRSGGQSRHSDLHTAFEGERQINLTSYLEDIEQTHHDQARDVDKALPSYGIRNLFPESYGESCYYFLPHPYS
jgi:hypothetical protein